MENDAELRQSLREYLRSLQDMLAGEAAKAGFLKDTVRSISELSALVRPFFEQCVRGYHAGNKQVDPLTVLGACCFAGAAAANIWNAVGEELLSANLFALLAQEKGMNHLEEAALDMAGMPGGTPDGDRFAACVKGNWSIMALAAWSGTARNRPAEEAMLFLQSTAQVLFVLGQAVVLARLEPLLHEEQA